MPARTLQDTGRNAIHTMVVAFDVILLPGAVDSLDRGCARVMLLYILCASIDYHFLHQAGFRVHGLVGICARCGYGW